jgi:hypothetical protein
MFHLIETRHSRLTCRQPVQTSLLFSLNKLTSTVAKASFESSVTRSAYAIPPYPSLMKGAPTLAPGRLSGISSVDYPVSVAVIDSLW